MGPKYYTSQPPQQSKFNKKIIFIILGVMVVLGGIMTVASLGGGDNIQLRVARAVQRQQQIVTLLEESSEKIYSSDLRKVNSDAALFLSTDLSELTKLMQSSGLKAVPKDLAASESTATSDKTLEQAAQAGRYDATYKEVLSQRIDTQQALLREISGETTKANVKQIADNAYEKLENVQKQLSQLP